MGAPTDEDSQKVCSAAQGGPQLRSISKLCPELPQNTPKPRGPGSKWGGEGSGQDFPQDTEVGSLISGHTSAPEVGVAGAGTPTPGSVGSQREGGIGDCGGRNCILISTAANCGGGRQTRVNLKRTWEKLLLAAHAIAIENPADVSVTFSRNTGQ